MIQYQNDSLNNLFLWIRSNPWINIRTTFSNQTTWRFDDESSATYIRPTTENWNVEILLFSGICLDKSA